MAERFKQLLVFTVYSSQKTFIRLRSGIYAKERLMPSAWLILQGVTGGAHSRDNENGECYQS